MANCHDLFQSFCGEIKLDDTKRKNLHEAKKAIRKKIKQYFRTTINEDSPLFQSQGSYVMGTIINPLSGEYDLDDGVYLQNLDSDRTKWKTPETVHLWICKAVEGHTKESPIDKRTCVRVIYSGQYYVDLPIYCMHDDKPYLAEKGVAGWHISDARNLARWFNSQVAAKGEQLRRIVMYLKAWADNKSTLGKLPSGLILTVLAVMNYANSTRDDTAFADTAKNVFNQISNSTVILNPVDQHERLSANVEPSQMTNLKQRLKTLLNNANVALQEDNKINAYKIWTKEFGDRFSSGEELDDKDVVNRTPPEIIVKNPSKPWIY